MNTTTNTTHADRIFSPEARYFTPEARYFAPDARYFAPGRIYGPEARYFAPGRIYSPQPGLTESMSCSVSPARLAGPAPGPGRPGVGWLRLP
jgi:hypothetical protein